MALARIREQPTISLASQAERCKSERLRRLRMLATCWRTSWVVSTARRLRPVSLHPVPMRRVRGEPLGPRHGEPRIPTVRPAVLLRSPVQRRERLPARTIRALGPPVRRPPRQLVREGVLGAPASTWWAQHMRRPRRLGGPAPPSMSDWRAAQLPLHRSTYRCELAMTADERMTTK